MTNETKHTPTPWNLQGVIDVKDDQEYGSAFIIGDNLGGLVGAALPFSTELDSGDFSRVEANAAHIVKCVNMHDELVGALKNLHVAALQSDVNDMSNDYGCDALVAAYETLKKAGAL